MKQYIMIGLVVLAMAAGAAAPVCALTIHGTLVNGTTGKPIDGTVKVVNPAGGMAQEKQVEAKDGSFTVENLDASAGIYLLRCDYAGVMYTETIRTSGEETLHATLTVYEQATSWDGIHVIVPHLAVAAIEGELQIEILYEIHNHVEPAGTIAEPDKQFLIYLPEDRVEIMRSFVAYGDIPIDRFPVPTDQPGIYRVDYPIRPGDTQVGISYTVPYSDSAYTVAYQLPYAIENMTIYAINANMGVSSGTLTLGPGESVHGMTAYSVSDVAAGTNFEVTFRGGDPITAAPGGGGSPHGGSGAQPAIIEVPNRMENPSILLMVAILLLMLAVLGMSARGAISPLNQPDQLAAYYQVLLKRLARLDDLNEAGAVAHDVYKVKRAELKNQLASLQYHMQTGKPRKRSRHREPSVAGNERTAP
jgi:hypothetical protein